MRQKQNEETQRQNVMGEEEARKNIYLLVLFVQKSISVFGSRICGFQPGDFIVAALVFFSLAVKHQQALSTAITSPWREHGQASRCQLECHSFPKAV